jgi:hypothetical protein
MNDARADSLDGTKIQNEGWRAGPKPGEGWPRKRVIFSVAIAIAAQVALIFVFGEKKIKPARTVSNVPQLQLADSSSELIALNDPALFALPHANDFASAVWLKMPANAPPDFRWTESPRWLPLAAENLGAIFAQFMATNRFADFQINFKPEPQFAGPLSPVESALPKNSTAQISGDLAQRRLLRPLDLPSLPYNDVIAPSVVQVLVDAPGNVVSAVLLPSENNSEAAGRLDAADQRALELARAARFAPALRLAVGKIIFNWHTVPLPATNSPAALP